MKLRLFKTLALSAALITAVQADKTQETQTAITPAPKAEKKHKAETIIVTANRSETNARAVSQSYTVISRDEIVKSQARNVIDIIKRVPGIHIAENGHHGKASIYIRGNHQYHTKILVNGANLADPGSTQVSASNILNALTLDNIERIEIVRGSQSTLYGSDAIGGVINVITRKSTEAISGNITQEFGSNDYQKTSASVLGAYKAFDYSLSLSYEDEKGVPVQETSPSDDGFRNKAFNGLIGYTVNDNLRFQLSGNYIESDNEFYQFSSHNETDTKNFVLRPEIQLTDLIDGRLDTTLAYSYSDTKRFNNEGFYYSLKGSSETIELNNKLFINDNYSIVFGYDNLKQRSSSNTNPNKIQTTQNEYYLQNQLQFQDTYFLEFGARYTDHSQFGKHITWQVAPSAYFEETGTRLHASAATGFRAPSNNELFGDSFGLGIGTPDLDPEKSKSFDLGFEQEVYDNKIKFGTTAFYSEFKNEIVYIGYVANAYQNVPGSKYMGLENFVSYQITDELFTQITYTRLKSDVDNSAGNHDAARRPNDTISFLVDWDVTDELNISTDVYYNGKRRDRNTTTDTLSSFWTADLKARYEINESFEIFGRVENLFDEDYEYAQDFTTLGRSFYGGITYTF